MDSLLRGLTEPRIMEDGSQRTPNMFMLRAAKVIQELLQLKQSNDKLVLEKQMEADKAHSAYADYRIKSANDSHTIETLRKQLEPIDLIEYKEIMNKDRE